MAPITPQKTPVHFFQQASGRGGYKMKNFLSFSNASRMVKVHPFRRHVVRAAQFAATLRFLLADHPPIDGAQEGFSPSLRFVFVASN